MTRTRNGSFHGTMVVDADVDAKMFTTRLKEIAQDMNMVYDIATGENSPSFGVVVQTMTHDGTALSGSLLGIPAINNTLDIRLHNEGSTADDTIYLWAAPVFVVTGENLYEIEVSARAAGIDLVIETYDTTGAIVQRLAGIFDEERLCWTQSLQFTTSGAVYYVAVRCSLNGEESFTFRGVRMWPSRPFASSSASPPPATVTALAPVPTAAAGSPMTFETIHDQMFVDNYAVAGWIVNTLNRNMTAFYEWLTGAPVPGNPTVTNADSSSTNPTTSRFAGHMRAGFASEPLVEFCLYSEGVGAIRTDGSQTVNNADPATTGIVNWHAPYPKVAHNNTVAVVHRARLMAPDFPTASNCTANVLCVNSSGKGTPANWQVRINASTASASGWVSLSQLGTTNFYVASIDAVSAGASVPFTPDNLDTYSIEMRNNDAGAFVFEEIALLGACIYFDP